MEVECGRDGLLAGGTTVSTLSIVAVLVLAVFVGPVGGATVDGESTSSGRSLDGSATGPASVGAQGVTTPTISNYAVTNPSGRDVRVSFDSDEQLETIEVSISGAESATLSTSDFSESSSDGTYTYTATYTGDSDGDYTATLETAADSDGNDGASGESATVTVDTRIPQISNYAVSNPAGQDVRVSFDSDEQLETIEVEIGGPESANLTTTNFTESASDGTYTYTATYAGSSDGTYTADLETAADASGNNGAGAESDSVTIDTTPPQISAFTVTNPSEQDIRISFESDELIDSLYVAIDGAESASLYVSDFLGAQSDGTYVYSATYEGSSDGNYTATLETATDTDGNDAGNGQNATVTVDTSDQTPPTISNYSVSNPADREIRISFDSDEQLETIDLDIGGAHSTTLTRANFTENGSDGTYSYVATYVALSDGSYTATLETAVDSAGNDGATGQNASLAIDTTAPTISAFAVSNPNDRVVQVTFESDEQLETVEASISGAESATLSTPAFAESAGNGTYTYTASYAAATDGNYTAALETAVDSAGNDGAGSQVATVTVSTPDETEPTASAGPNRTADAGETVTFDASESVDNVAIETFEWDFDGDGTNDATGPTATHSFAEPGTYTVTLTVTDQAGNTDTDTVTVSVAAVSTTATPGTTTTLGTTTETPTTETATGTPSRDDTTPSGDGDGFTALAVVVALIATALLGTRRR